MDCVFCSIAEREEDAVVVDETDETIAFAPLNPISEGHLLVIPKAHYENLFDVPDPTLRAVMKHAKSIARRLRADDFDGVNLLHASGKAAQQSVPHFHIHLAPRRSDDRLDLWPESTFEESEFNRIYEDIRAMLEDEDSL
ncbi:histidine triad nucleotide-binding protein [Haloterrigena salina JCM 13891]|uniref:Histidine triad nucleotide-binding protein n=1 Tax=Haloterrigena salina JCM 13891 TaxID=1227488 RepID=M0C381_9EURY|nr:HIT domain-containing protein [Haloterrigena salina]ELZ16787.1 histidine triad nucleotide-binding protein [Haloterrigena salina JCM 13891]